jgi:hypothetical protein
MEISACKLPGLAAAVCLLMQGPAAFAQQTPLQIISFSVSPDQTLTYPNSSSGANQLQGFSDLHPTFFPQAGSGAPYLVFGSAQTSLSSGNFWGAVVLQTTDLMTFDFAPGYNLPVLTSPVPYAICNPTYDTTWDENYAGPGTVFQDPTLPAGNLIMLIDAEQHCPGGVWQSPFYITVGLARSSDNGKTWPAPESGAPSRYAVLQSPEPITTVPHDDLGNGIPTGFVDKSASGDYYLYVAYTDFPSSGTRVARAQLGVNPLMFLKWYNGSFTQPGIGGLDSDVKPSAPGCASAYPENPEISYNDDLGLYLMIFKCLSGTADAGVGGWYYSTATSLDLEDWTTPQLIQNSQYPWASCTPPPGQEFDGHLPSTLSPGAAPGHTKLTGYIFLTNKTCDLASRQFLSRTFTITAAPLTAPTIAKAFSPATIHSGGESTVTLTLANSNSSALTDGAFNDTLVNMGAAGGGVAGTCTGTVPSSQTAGQTALSFTGITIPASGQCTVTFSVTSNTPGARNNTTSGVTTTQTTSAGAASNNATLTVLGCTVTGDRLTSVSDVRFMINEALGIGSPISDLNHDSVVNLVDVQIVINASLGLGCTRS